jgi:hypothetical protein
MQERKYKIFWFVVLFVLGGAGVLFILPNFGSRLVFSIFLGIILLWTARVGHKLDINSLALITAYVISVAVFGLHFYFRLPAAFIMALTFTWVSLSFWLGFKLKMGIVSASAKILSLTAGLAAAQVATVLLFWPTHFLVTSTVFFLLYYLAWMMAAFYMSGLLNSHRIMIHVTFTGVILLIVLLTAQWTI